MAIQPEGTPTVGEVAAATTVDCAVPAGAVAGEYLIAAVTMQPASAALLPDQTGWTSLGKRTQGTIGTAIYGRVATGSEPASYTFSGGASGAHGVAMRRYSGVDTTTPEDVTEVTAVAASGTTLTFAGLTTVTAGALIIYVTGTQTTAATRTWTATTAGPVEWAQTTGIARRGYFWDEARPTAGATGQRVFTSSNNLPHAGVMVALRPAAGGGGGDTTAPTVPSNAQAVADSATQVTISWTASTDAVGVSSYRVRRGGVDLAGATAVAGTSFVDTTASPSTAYSYTVSAVDAAGNRSAESTAATVTTPASSGGTGTVLLAEEVPSGYHLTGSATTGHTTGTLTGPIAAGNLLIAQFSVDKSAGTFTPPAGWSVAVNVPGASVSTLIIYRVATGSGDPTSATATWSTASDGVAAIISRWTGVDPADPLGPITAPAYVDTARTSLALDPAAADVGGSSLPVAFLCADSIESTTSTTGFRPASSGWTWRDTAASLTDLGAPATALVTRDAQLTAGQNLASTTFTWTTSEQTYGAMLLLNAAAAAATPTLTYRALGIPTDTSIEMSARTTEATSVRAQCSTSATFASGIISGSAVTPNAQGDSILSVTGLTAGTSYYTRIGMTVGGVETFSAISTKAFKTDNPGVAGNFSFSFSSCDDAADAAIWSTIAARNDDMFFQLGDWFDDPGAASYADGTGTDLTNMRLQLSRKLSPTNHAALLSCTPMDFTPSDHDTTVNNGNAGSQPTAMANLNAAIPGDPAAQPVPRRDRRLQDLDPQPGPVHQARPALLRHHRVGHRQQLEDLPRDHPEAVAQGHHRRDAGHAADRHRPGVPVDRYRDRGRRRVGGLHHRAHRAGELLRRLRQDDRHAGRRHAPRRCRRRHQRPRWDPRLARGPSGQHPVPEGWALLRQHLPDLGHQRDLPVRPVRGHRHRLPDHPRLQWLLG